LSETGKNYKNFLFFIKAVAPILNSHPEMFIVAAGGNKFTKEEHQWIKKLGISNQIIQQKFRRPRTRDLLLAGQMFCLSFGV